MRTRLRNAAAWAAIALAMSLAPCTGRAQSTSLITYYGTVSQVAGPTAPGGRFKVRVDNNTRFQHGTTRVGVGQPGAFALTFVSTNNQAAGGGDVVSLSVIDSIQFNVVVAVRTLVLGVDAITSGMQRVDLLLTTGLGVDVVNPGPKAFQPGASTNVTVEVMNTGTVTDSFRLMVMSSNPGWGVQYPQRVTGIAPGGSATPVAVVSVPAGAHSGLEYLFVFASSLTNSLVNDFTTIPTAIPSDVAPVAVTRLALEQNRPNPFNPNTEIEFALPSAGSVWLSVFDLRGRRIRALVSGGTWQPGRHRVSWDGTDDQGRVVAGGVYAYRLVTPAGELTRRMVLA